MNKIKLFALILVSLSLAQNEAVGCSVLYYINSKDGKIYFVNNEDYWYDVNPFIRIMPRSRSSYARLWYGWDRFAQGGVNEKGLVFDAAVTPEQAMIPGYKNPNSNLGDNILANCATVQEALDYLQEKSIGLTNAHMLFGDRNGNAVIVEWVKGQRMLHWITNNMLIMTNFLLSDTTAGNYPCYRYNAIKNNILDLEKSTTEISLLRVGNTVGQSVQPPKSDETGRIGGTLYTSFINLTDFEFVLSFKISNKDVIKLDLNQIFSENKRKTIKLD
jgi:choloylglycine hydrolase